MKKIVFFLTINFFVNTAIAQSSEQTSTQSSGIYIQGGAGGALPMADLNSFVPNSTKSGYAKPGFGWQLSGGYRFASKVFFELNFSSNNYNTDFSNQNSIYASQYNMASNVVADNYHVNFLMAGAGYSFNLSKRIQFDVKGMLGPVWSKRPSSTYYLANNTTIVQNEAKSVNVGFLLGTVFAFGISPQVYLYGGFDFYFANLTYDNVRTVAPNDVMYNNLKIFSASANPGLGIRFYF